MKWRGLSSRILGRNDNALVAGIRANGSKTVTTVHAATDHCWSDARVRLASDVIRWLGGVR